MVVSSHFYEIFSKAYLYRSIFFLINILLISLLAFLPSLKILAIIGASFNFYHGLLVFMEAYRVNDVKRMTHPDDRYLAEYLSFFRHPYRFLSFYTILILCYIGLAIFYKCVILLSMGIGLLFPVFAYLYFRKGTVYLYDVKHHLRRSELYAKYK